MDYAFPLAHDIQPDKPGGRSISVDKGMTLRDYFAAKAMHALMRNVSADVNAAEYASDIAHYSYRMADAMIERRNV